MAVRSHQQIGAAVVVEVRGDGAEAEAVATHAGLVGDIREFAVAVVAVQVIVRHRGGPVAQRVGMHPLPQRPAAHHVKVRLTVVVVVEPHAPGAGAFQQRAQFFRSEGMREGDARLRRSIFKANRTGVLSAQRSGCQQQR